MGGKRIPWPAVRKEFVEGVVSPAGDHVFPTIIELAERYGIARESISRKASADDWDAARALYQERVQELADQQKARMLSGPKPPTVEERAEELERDLAAFGAASPAREEEAKPPPTAAAALAGTQAPADYKTLVIASERAKFDTTCVTLAKALQAEVAATIQRSRKKHANGAEPIPLPPADLQRLAATLERSQRIGRLALGQTTENQGHSAPDGSSIKVDAEMSVDVSKSGYDKLSPAELARLYAEAVRSGPADGEGQGAPGAHKGAPRA